MLYDFTIVTTTYIDVGSDGQSEGTVQALHCNHRCLELVFRTFLGLHACRPDLGLPTSWSRVEEWILFDGPVPNQDQFECSPKKPSKWPEIPILHTVRRVDGKSRHPDRMSQNQTGYVTEEVSCRDDGKMPPPGR